MAVEIQGHRYAAKAAADLTGKKYYIGKIDSNGQIAVAAAGEGIGIIIEEAKAGGVATLQLGEITKVVASGAIGAGVHIAADANGKAVAAAANTKAVAYTLGAATADGDIISALVTTGIMLHA